MKKYFVLLTFFSAMYVSCLFGQQVNISNSSNTQDPGAILDLKSNDKGLLLPRMTAAQRAAINNPAKGLLVFQTDGAAGFYYYDGNTWLSLAGGVSVNADGFSQNYGLTTVLAGRSFGYADGIGSTAKFRGPVGLTIDRFDNLYVADTGGMVIRKIAPGSVVSLVAGSAQGLAGNVNGAATQARFNSPTGIASDALGNLYVTDFYNHTIRRIDQSGSVITFAGDGIDHFADGIGTTAGFSHPGGITLDAQGNIYVADSYNNRIRKITGAGVVTTLAGNSTPGFVNGTGAAASFDNPMGLAIDAGGNIYVADMDNHSIRKLTPAGVVTTLAGTGSRGHTDGAISIATFDTPKGIAIDKSGNIYIADAGNHAIRKITPDGVVSTLAGAGSPGFYDGIGADVFFNDPSGVLIDNKGNLYVSDTGNHLIRKIILH